jgi:hypothetical protein
MDLVMQSFASSGDATCKSWFHSSKKLFLGYYLQGALLASLGCCYRVAQVCLSRLMCFPNIGPLQGLADP